MNPQIFEALKPPALTIQQHIVVEQQRFPDATGEFSFLLSGLTLATKKIQAQVRSAGINNILGEFGEVNIQGESQQILDVYSNRVMIESLSSRKSVGVIAVIFDPLDGSSNIDVNVSVGTTFSIFRRPASATGDDPNQWVLQKGTEQIGAGYVVYGSSTVMVYTVGNGVHGFTLDPSIGAFVLSHENIRMPKQGKSYSVNEAYMDDFPPNYQEYISHLRSGDAGSYRSRYIGSMVADFHRTLLRGGIFIYPPTEAHKSGKLRLLYEANPIAMIAELDPQEVHQRTPLVVGSQHEMKLFGDFA